MTSPSPRPDLQTYTRLLCDDALFVVASAQRFDPALLAEVARRRVSSHEPLMRAESPELPSWQDHAVAMCATLAPLAPPPWLPMSELIESITLEAGARGVRSLFTSKPSERQVQRTRLLAATALRYLTATMAADAPLDDEERLLRRCLASGFGLPAQDVTALLDEEAAALEPVDPGAGLDNKLARSMAYGLWLAGMRDGLDPKEESTITQACVNLGLGPDATEAARKDARTRLDARGALAVASVDAIRYVLADDPENASKAASAAARLGLAPVHRTETTAAIDQGAPVVLARRHSLDSAGRQACLAMAWLAALATDPPVSRLGELALRHDRVASDIDAKGDGAGVRAQVFGLVQEHLSAAAQSLGL